MLNENPFYLSKVECPVCKTVNEFETLRVGAFIENNRDTDFCPQDIKWKYPRFQAHHPLSYFVTTCTNCFYSREFTNKFKDWKNDNNFRAYRLKAVKSAHLDKLAEADSIIKSLGTSIDMGKFPNESGVMKLLLAIYDEMLYDHPQHLDLGRFYLRIGWIFRSQGQGEDPGTQFLSGLMTESSQKYADLKGHQAEFVTDISIFKNHLFSHMANERLDSETRDVLSQFNQKFDAEFQELNRIESELAQQINNIGNVLNEYKASALGGEGSLSMTFGEYSSFADCLLSLKKSWSGIVVNEQEALERAVYHYKEAMEDKRAIQPGNQQIQASYLIAELSRRVGDFDGARQYFNTTIKYGQEYIYQNRQSQAKTALSRKILELALEQGKLNLAQSKENA